MTVSSHTIAQALKSYRSAQPLVQSLTNIVVANWTANVLLASGAAPAMVDNPNEAGIFATVASGVLVNLGTPYADTVEGMREAAKAARAAKTPWVLDAVAVGGLPWRTEIAVELATSYGPTIIRGNASEISGLSGAGGGRGVDSTHSTDDVKAIADSLAKRLSCVVAVSGEVDYITDGTNVVRISNGHEMMTRVTGVGCSLGSLMAGFAAVTDPLNAAASATALLTVAAERAMALNPGPGTFAVSLLDHLALSPEELEQSVRLS